MKVQTYPCLSSPQKARRQPTSHNGLLPLEGVVSKSFRRIRSATAGSRGAKQEWGDLVLLSALSSALWFLIVGGSAVSVPTGMELCMRVDFKNALLPLGEPRN